MEKIHYDDLQDAYNLSLDNFEKYETEIRNIIGKLRSLLIKSLNCDPNKIIWVKYAEIDEEVENEEYLKNNYKEIPTDRKIIILNSGYCKFCFRILFETRGIDINFKIKIWQGKIIFTIGEESHQLSKGNDEEFLQFVQLVIAGTNNYINNLYLSFINDNQKPSIGFSIK